MKKPKFFPSLETFREKAETSSIIPVYREILADTDTPVSAFLKIDNGGDAFLLESVEGGERWGRYSFLGVSPRMTIRSKGRTVEVIEAGGVKTLEGDPLDMLKGLMSKYGAAARVEGAPLFFGGAIGYLSYDMVRHIERLPETSRRDLDIYDMYFMLTDTLLVFDNVEHSVKVVSNAFIEDPSRADEVYKSSTEKIDSLIGALRSKSLPAREASPGGPLTVRSNFEREDFLSAVQKIKGYIEDGDCIQTVLSQRFEAPSDMNPFDAYRALRVVNPSPYMFFLRTGDLTLVGSSPEILVRVEEDEVTVRPIAGTRRRGRDEEEDKNLEKELLKDPKELAEHIMLVDLGRNDVGRVCMAGTIEVDELMTVERYSHVMHIVSNVKGRLLPGKDSFDSLRACFPAGTLTGAPKVRAMEIIEELEPCRRGVYGGSVGYIGYTGNMDMCIAIRTMVIKDGKIFVQAGAGVVADSIPEKELEETENKARGMLKAVDMARAEGTFL